MSQVPILKTKLYIPPIRPKLVSRPRLIEQRKAGLHRKLTIISAPAGFGKTTLVSEWVQAMMGLDLSAEDIAALAARTEGWIADIKIPYIKARKGDEE